MSKVRIVTDSTSDIPLRLLEQYGIVLVPLNVHFGDDVYKDMTELTPEQFIERLVKSKVHPRTSQPSPGEFVEVYRTVVEAGEDIVSMHLSSLLSGTCQSAAIAKGSFPDARIEIIDTRLASLAAGLAVLEAARAAQEGASVDEVVRVAKAACERCRVFFAVDTLDYLYRNGRIGKAAHLMGSLLNMKPILTLVDGQVTSFDKVRGQKRAIGRLVEILHEKVPKEAALRVAVMHSACLSAAEALASEIARDFKVEETIISSLGAVIATHVGPGTIAVATLPESPK